MDYWLMAHTLKLDKLGFSKPGSILDANWEELSNPSLSQYFTVAT